MAGRLTLEDVLGVEPHSVDLTLKLQGSTQELREVADAIAVSAPAGVTATFREGTRTARRATELAGVSTLTIRRAARAVGQVVREPGATVADLQALAVELQTAVREVERQRAAVFASAESPGLVLATFRWTVAGGLAGIVGALIALLAYVQATIKDAHPDPPPSVTVVVPRSDPAEIERIVDERMREREVERYDTAPSTASDAAADRQ